MNRRINSLCVFIFCILQCAAVITHAQEPGGIFHHLTTKNGLSSNRVNMVMQDREGFYWIATGDGLNRFDGSNCKVFRNIRNDSTSLSHNNCFYLVEDDKGDIWIATTRGVNRYTKSTGRFERFYLSHPTMLDDQVNAIKGMVKDEQGNIWIASAGLWQYNIYSGKWTRYLHDPHVPASVPAGFNNRLQYDKINKGLWMGNSGLVFFDIVSGKFYHSANNPEKKFPFEKLTYAGYYFLLDSSGVIWFYNYPGPGLCSYSVRSKTITEHRVKNLSTGTYSIYNYATDAENRIWLNYWGRSTEIFDPRTNKMDTGFLAHRHQQSPLSSIVTHLYIDKTGNYWISSANGISIYKPRAQGVKYVWLNPKQKAEQNFDNSITCLAEQNENILWVGTGTGLFRYDRVEKKFTAIERLPFSNHFIRRLFIQGDSVLWIGSWNELMLFDLRSEQPIKKISPEAKPQFITVDDKNNIWMGTWSHGLFKFSSSGRLIDRLTHEENGDTTLRYYGLTCFDNSSAEPGFWAGYNFEHGFFKLNYKDNSIENFKIPVSSANDNTSNSVNAIAEDKQKNLWLGTYGGGLVYFDRKKNSFTTYTQSEGLKSDYINRILLDDRSNAWVSTPNGISIIDGSTYSIINTEIDLTFDNNDFVTNGIRLRNGKLLFFSGLKLAEIDPIAYLQSAYPSKILLSNFKIFEKEATLTENKDGRSAMNLSYRQNSFSFEYSLLKPNPESGTQYAYKLDGFDEDWNHVKERRTAYYTNVPPGSYNFQVKATDESGKWVYNSSPVVITISPPFWKTWWFYVLSGLLVAGTIFIVVRNRIEQIKKREQERFRLIVATQEKEKKNISAELHDDLGVRLSALKYFVTSLKKYISSDDEAAQETYNKTMVTIDESVEDIRYMLINLSPKTLMEYGYLTAVEDLANKLSRLHIIKVHLKQKGIEQRMPADIESGLYRITQELINNTLKHAAAGSIYLDIENINGFVSLQYADDGKGFDLSKSEKGYGIENIHTRVALLNGKIEWDAEKSARVSIIIPLPHT